jgi:hypothetical protein
VTDLIEETRALLAASAWYSPHPWSVRLHGLCVTDARHIDIAEVAISEDGALIAAAPRLLAAWLVEGERLKAAHDEANRLWAVDLRSETKAAEAMIAAVSIPADVRETIRVALAGLVDGAGVTDESEERGGRALAWLASQPAESGPVSRAEEGRAEQDRAIALLVRDWGAEHAPDSTFDLALLIALRDVLRGSP